LQWPAAPERAPGQREDVVFEASHRSPARRNVTHPMFRLRHHFQIFEPVVVALAVLVVNDHPLRDRAMSGLVD
jgi:hypothetical protein